MDEQKKKILLVEDEEDARQMMAAKLRSAGYQVFEAGNGEEAYTLAQDVIPNLIISDIVMPGLDGAHLLKKLRESYFGRDIPFMVITARPHMRDYFETMGVDDFLTKPCAPEEFMKRVNQMFTKSKPIAKTRFVRRVMVVGNDGRCVDTMVALLNEQGCHTDCVTSGEQVISKAVMFLPNVLILEAHMMSGMSSAEAVHVLRQMPQFKKIPILLYSFYDQTGLKKDEIQQRDLMVVNAVTQCKESGANEYVGKFDKATFITQIERYLRKGEVILIDDDRGLTQLLKVELEKEGYSVKAAPDGEKGLELIKNEKPNVILLDVVLPGMNGYDVLGQLKTNPQTKNIPVIMMTVKGEHSEIQKALDLGVDDYIVKPFYAGLLKKRIKSWIPE